MKPVPTCSHFFQNRCQRRVLSVDARKASRTLATMNSATPFRLDLNVRRTRDFTDYTDLQIAFFCQFAKNCTKLNYIRLQFNWSIRCFYLIPFRIEAGCADLQHVNWITQKSLTNCQRLWITKLVLNSIASKFFKLFVSPFWHFQHFSMDTNDSQPLPLLILKK